MLSFKYTLAFVLALAVLGASPNLPSALAYDAVEYRREPVIGFGNKTGYRDDAIDQNTFEVRVTGNSFSSQVHMMSIALSRMAELSNERGYTHFVVTKADASILCNQAATVGSPRLEIIGKAGQPDSFSDDARVFSVSKVLATVLQAVKESEVSKQDNRSIANQNAKLCSRPFRTKPVQPWHLFNIMEGQEFSASSTVTVDETLDIEVIAENRFKIQAKTTGFTQTTRLTQLALLEGASLAREAGYSYLMYEDLAVATPCSVKGVEAAMQITLVATKELTEIPDDRVAMSVDKIDSVLRPVITNSTPDDDARRGMYRQNAKECFTVQSMLTWGAPWTAFNIIARPLPPRRTSLEPGDRP